MAIAIAAVDATDLAVLLLVVLATLVYVLKGRLAIRTTTTAPFVAWRASRPDQSAAVRADPPTRVIADQMERTVEALVGVAPVWDSSLMDPGQDKQVVVFYGSQTGTAEDYASRFAKEAHARFGLASMTADLEEYEYESLDRLSPDKLVVFVLATYGEGEPTDNATEFVHFITSDPPAFEQPLSHLRYVAFGLGNRTYEHYNAVVKNVDGALARLGSKRLGPLGLADDSNDAMEEDFLTWKEAVWNVLRAELDLVEREAVYEQVYEVSLDPALGKDHPDVYLGEPNRQHLKGIVRPPYNAHNPYIAPVVGSRELFAATALRNCLHVEIDLSESGLKFSTGDHIAVWPCNNNNEIDRLLAIFGLEEQRDCVLRIRSADPTTKLPVPSPTTYDSILRYYLEICGPVSRQNLALFAQFAPDQASRDLTTKLGGDKSLFAETVSKKYRTLGQTLEMISNGKTWTAVPFSLVLESLNHLQPRYYSISSSSRHDPVRPSITAVVEARKISEIDSQILYGVTTNYLLALKLKQNGEQTSAPDKMHYKLSRERITSDGIYLPVHIRHSNFKLPSDPTKPIVMVGPGTGVAPFRAFVQERAILAREGKKIGKMVLFYGCRRCDEDFLYREEWTQWREELNDSFVLITAFSRESDKKVYVQHQMDQHGGLVSALLQDGGYFYVCGDAVHMARDVNATLARVIERERKLKPGGGEEVVKMMRVCNYYLEDVWS